MEKSQWTGKYSKIITEYYKRIQWVILDYNRRKKYGDDYFDNRDFCYLVKNKENGLYKIGVTGDYNRRYSQLDREGNIKMVLLIQIANGNDYGDSHWLERFVKDYYKAKSRKKEWFEFSRRDILNIRDLFWEIFGDDIWDEKNPYLMLDRRTGLYKQIG